MWLKAPTIAWESRIWNRRYCSGKCALKWSWCLDLGHLHPYLSPGMALICLNIALQSFFLGDIYITTWDVSHCHSCAMTTGPRSEEGAQRICSSRLVPRGSPKHSWGVCTDPAAYGLAHDDTWLGRREVREWNKDKTNRSFQSLLVQWKITENANWIWLAWFVWNVYVCVFGSCRILCYFDSVIDSDTSHGSVK